MSRLSMQTAIGASKLINDNLAILNAVGLTPEEYDVIIQEEQWNSTQRTAVTAAIKQMVAATLENAALVPVKLPTEFIIGVIVSTVNPVNWFIACYWLATESATGAPADELADRYSSALTNSTAEEMIAICVQVAANVKKTEFNNKFKNFIKGKGAK